MQIKKVSSFSLKDKDIQYLSKPFFNFLPSYAIQSYCLYKIIFCS